MQNETSPEIEISYEEFIEWCKNDLITFAKLIYPGYQAPRHIVETAKILEAVERGDTKRVMFSFPPRHGKTVLISQIFPIWFLGRHPKEFMMLACNSSDLATESGMEVINFLRDENYNAVFPGVKLSKESYSKVKLRLTTGGKAFFLGVGSTATGKGANVLVIDDPIKDPEQADSEAYKKKLRSWYQQVARTRLMPGGRMVVVGTRWRVDDLHGWLLDPEANPNYHEWKVVNFPAVAEEDNVDWRKAGEALWPEQFDAKHFEDERIAQGTRGFLALYQQRPVAAEGNIIHSDWIVKLPISEEIKAMPPRVAFLDTAFKTDTTNDYSAVAIGYRTNTHFVVEYTEHKRLEFPQLIEWTKDLINTHALDVVCVEDKASGQSLIQTLKQQLPTPILPIKAELDKVSRVNAAAPLFEARKILFREPINPAAWEELISFPSGKNDDLVDAVVGLITVLSNKYNLRSRNSAGQIPTIYRR